MNSRFYRLVSILVMFCLCFNLTAVSTEALNEDKVVEYDYPIKPGTKEWSYYHSKALEKMCEIPEDVLPKLTTNQLVELVLNYPFIIHFYCFNTQRAGFMAVYERFNGLRELLNREDGAQKLFKRYRDTEFNRDSETEILHDVQIMEIILIQPELREGLTDKEIYDIDCFLSDSCLHTLIYVIKEPKKTVEYDYPVKPGTKEWGQLSVTQRRESCQIPFHTLRKLNTKQLVDLALENPFYGAMYMYIPVQKGFNVIHRSYNVISQLLKRKDAGKYLIEKYKATSVKEKAESHKPYDIHNIEILLAQKEIQDSFSKKELKELNQLVEQKQVVKSYYPNTFSSSYYNEIIESNWSTKLLIEEIEEVHSANESINKSEIFSMVVLIIVALVSVMLIASLKWKVKN